MTLRTATPAVVLLAALAAMACGDSSLPSEPAVAATEAGPMSFNPQPEPPAYIGPLVLGGPIDGRWVGRYGDRLEGVFGQVEVTTLRLEETAGAVRLSQTWTIYPPDPGEPFDADMSGNWNVRDGSFVMNGAGALGRTVHVQGEASLDGGILSMSGELMFNPQPEPPAVF